MSKYQINYSRTAPDHRVPFDYQFVQKTRNPLQYFKYYKQGFNTSWNKYYHMHLSGLACVALTAIIVYIRWDEKEAELIRDKIRKMPNLHFVHQFQNKNTAPWDNILKKFSTDPKGLRDQPFEEY